MERGCAVLLHISRRCEKVQFKGKEKRAPRTRLYTFGYPHGTAGYENRGEVVAKRSTESLRQEIGELPLTISPNEHNYYFYFAVSASIGNALIDRNHKLERSART